MAEQSKALRSMRVQEMIQWQFWLASFHIHLPQEFRYETTNLDYLAHPVSHLRRI
jgi:hypothetical protein